MKAFVMLSVVCFLLTRETSSRAVVDNSEENSSEECRDSSECESEEDTSSSEAQIGEERQPGWSWPWKWFSGECSDSDECKSDENNNSRYRDLKLQVKERLIAGTKLPIHPASLTYTSYYTKCRKNYVYR